MPMKFFLTANKEYRITFLISIFISIVFIYYKIPWGLMDDYKWIVLTEEFINNPINKYIEFQKMLISKGTLQPFIQLQLVFQYLIGIYINPLFTHIQNIFIIFFSHLFLYKLLKNKIQIKYSHSLSVFMIFPYTFDMFLLPSLQEKFTIPLFALLLHSLEKNKDNDKFLFVFLLSFSIPLIKLQGSVFVLFIFFYTLLNKTKKSLFSLLGFALAILVQAYILFFGDKGYYIVDNSFSQILSNLLSPQNLFFLLITIISLFFAIIEKNKEAKFYIFGLVFSGLALQFILINWENYGYLFSFYSFFLALLIPYCGNFLLEKINIQIFFKLTTYSLIGLMLLSSFFFFLPRIERWSDLNSVYENLDEIYFENEIYYCGSEGVLTFNNLNNSLTEVKFAGNFEEINEAEFYFIKDDLQCNYLENNLNDKCEQNNGYNSKYRRVEIIKYSC